MRYSSHQQFMKELIRDINAERIERGRDLTEYEFLVVYLRRSDCKKVMFSHNKCIFFFPDYDTQTYSSDVNALFTQLQKASSAYTNLWHSSLYDVSEVERILRVSSYVEQAQFAPSHMIQTNKGILDTYKNEFVDKLPSKYIFTSNHYLDDLTTHSMNKQISQLLTAIAGDDYELLQSMYLIMYLTLTGQGQQHVTFLTGSNQVSKDAFIMLLKILATKEASLSDSVVSLQYPDSMSYIPSGCNLIYSELNSANTKYIANTSDIILHQIYHKPLMLRRKYLDLTCTYHPGMNVHAFDVLPTKCIDLYRLHNNYWELNFDTPNEHVVKSILREIAAYYNIETYELEDCKEFEARLLATTLSQSMISSYEVLSSQLQRLDDCTCELRESRHSFTDILEQLK